MRARWVQRLAGSVGACRTSTVLGSRRSAGAASGTQPISSSVPTTSSRAARARWSSATSTAQPSSPRTRHTTTGRTTPPSRSASRRIRRRRGQPPPQRQEHPRAPARQPCHRPLLATAPSRSKPPFRTSGTRCAPRTVAALAASPMASTSSAATAVPAPSSPAPRCHRPPFRLGPRSAAAHPSRKGGTCAPCSSQADPTSSSEHASRG
mmetsp:Transcript_49680/g.138058  ORF Transcript_49680/g.138058 Transcript_49680/m.138058 type:complete len:208 (+) Transcript_49680:1511-2134(+)